MKSLPLKLAIIIVVVFGLLIAGMLAYPALRIKWLASKLYSAEGERFEETVTALIESGPDGCEAVERYFSTAKTGWGRPAGGLVARLMQPEPAPLGGLMPRQVKPEPALLGSTGELYVGIEIRNITNKTIHVESPTPVYNELKTSFGRLGGWGTGGNYRIVVNFPKDIEPGKVYRVAEWAKIDRVERDMDKPELGRQVGVWLHECNTSGRYDRPELVNRSILVMQAYVRAGRDRKGPKAYTNRVTVKLDPPMDPEKPEENK